MEQTVLRWLNFTTPSTLQLGSLVELLLNPVPCPNLQAQLHLGLHEALVNAVRHGNGNDPEKSVRIRRTETTNWLVWQVQDEGPGIPPHCRRADLCGQLDASHGRGLFLIHHCFDDVRWSRQGNRVQLAVRRERPC
ncbi:ATP-binding protein [Cyanobium sp. HWJ4-Hawea]|nr:ATP-binding protein [Cyanobium sp. HWJ4-Hawea]